MAEKRGPDLGASWVASGDLRGAQYKAVTFLGLDVYLANSGVITAGILQNKPADNDHAAVATIGFSKVVLAGSLASAVELMAGANGFVTIAASGGYVLGALLSAGDSGTIQEAMLSPYRRGA
jgi:hypothetical protein